MKPRRILIFSLVYYPRNIGGAEVAVKEITDRIDPNEAVFDMVTIGDGSGKLEGRFAGSAEEIVGNVRVHRLFKDIGPIQKLLFPFAAFWKACALHRANHYDAIWSIMANRAGFAALFFKWTHPKVPFILTLQEGDPLDYPMKRAGIAYPLFKYIFRKAHRITAISTFLADWSRDMGAKCPIDIIPNGVDYRLFSSENTAKAADQARFPLEIAHNDIAALKEKLGKKPGDVFLVTASRLVAKNAVDDIINALQCLPANVKLLVIGAGALEDDLKAQAIRLGLNSKGSDRVLFIGFVPHSDLPKYLHASDIFIRPSRSEGLGNSFLEAMAAGIPVIGTPVGGIPDFLKDGETGLICDIDSPRSIAQKVEKLMKDRESREYIVRNARKMVEDKYRWEAIAVKMNDVFKSARLIP